MGKKKILLLKGKGKEVSHVCPSSSLSFNFYILLLPLDALVRFMLVNECRLVIVHAGDNVITELSCKERLKSYSDDFNAMLSNIP